MTMFSQSQFQTLFAYNWYVRSRLLEGAAQHSEPDYRDNPGCDRGSIHDLLSHLLGTDRTWRAGLETGQRPPPTQPAGHEASADLGSALVIQVGVQIPPSALFSGKTEAETVLNGVFRAVFAS